MAGIAALRAAGLSVQTNTTITALNLGKAADMPDFLASIGIERFSMNLFIPTGRGGTADGLFVPYSKIGPVVDSVRKAAFARNLTFYWYSPTPHCLFNPIARGMGNKSCAAVDGLVSVNPRGEVLPCSSWNEPLGNLLTGDFDEIWFSERALHFKHKEKAPALCAGCSRFVACQGACPLYWKWAGEGELASVSGRKGGEVTEKPAEAVPAVP
jgi:radical SAM protein with 4Fe4S-binding SPASM domain